MTVKAEKRLAYSMLALPAVLIYLAVVAFPTIFSIVLSLTDYRSGQIFGPDTTWSFIGFDNYTRMLTDQNFYTSLLNNLKIVGVSVFGQIPLGFILAYILARKLIKRGSNFFQAIIYLPNIISPIIIGLLFRRFVSGRDSVLMELRQLINPEATFSMPTTGMGHMAPVLFVILWMFTGFYMIIFLANMQRIDPAIIEAARIDGAKEHQILRHIMLPSLTGVIVTCSILAISGSLRTFDLIFGMTGGGPAGLTRVLAMYMHDMAFSAPINLSLANAISTVMVVISIILIIIVRFVSKIFAEKGD